MTIDLFVIACLLRLLQCCSASLVFSGRCFVRVQNDKSNAAVNTEATSGIRCSHYYWYYYGGTDRLMFAAAVVFRIYTVVCVKSTEAIQGLVCERVYRRTVLIMPHLCILVMYRRYVAWRGVLALSLA